MRQSDGGYVLVYVVVVIVILCILVPAACTNSLQNLKAQQASIERMQQLYAAEGQMERLVAEVVSIPKTRESQALSNSEKDAVEAAQETVKSIINEAIGRIINNTGTDALNKEHDSWNWENPSYMTLIISKVGEITVKAEIKFQLDIHIEASEETETLEDGSEHTKGYSWSYEITDCTITYESYEISTTTAGEGENQP